MSESETSGAIVPTEHEEVDPQPKLSKKIQRLLDRAEGAKEKLHGYVAEVGRDIVRCGFEADFNLREHTIRSGTTSNGSRETTKL